MLAGGGTAMRWFTRGKRKEMWAEEIQWPIGDIEAAHKIRDICRSALDSAEKEAAFADPPNNKKKKDNKKSKYETKRYQRAPNAAMEISIKISDSLLRDSSLRQIATLALTANH